MEEKRGGRSEGVSEMKEETRRVESRESFEAPTQGEASSEQEREK